MIRILDNARRRAYYTMLLPLALFCFGAFDRIWTTEDAFITFRVVENVWRGYGPVYNQGMRVEAYTHPLWLGILCLLRVFGQEHLGAVAALTGILFSCLGFTLAMRASLWLWSRPGGAGQAAGGCWPAGSFVVAALPVFWDFSSSGLEGGLTFLWLGGAAFGLTCVADGRRAGWATFWISLGPLIRPDLGVFWVCFLAALLVAARPPKIAPFVLKIGSLALALPLLYQVFRMGYFAATVPNTALAKEGFLTNWPQGIRYLWDTVGVYYLWFPLGVVVWASIVRLSGERSLLAKRGGQIIPGVFIVGGLLHILSIVRLGGGFYAWPDAAARIICPVPPLVCHRHPGNPRAARRVGRRIGWLDARSSPVLESSVWMAH